MGPGMSEQKSNAIASHVMMKNPVSLLIGDAPWDHSIFISIPTAALLPAAAFGISIDVIADNQGKNGDTPLFPDAAIKNSHSGLQNRGAFPFSRGCN
jgi:hypothetical protein